MSMTQAAQKWLSSLEASQQIYSGHKLAKTLSYLQKARNAGDGWGHYPGMKSDLYHSALVIQALSSTADEAYVGTVAGAASYLRYRNEEGIDAMQLDEVCNLLYIARAEQRPDDDDYVQLLFDALTRHCEERAQRKEPVPTRVLCEVMLATLPLRKAKIELVTAWAEKLIDLQLVDGSWPAVADGESSVVMTAMAVRALKYVDGEKAAEALGRGVLFLQQRLEAKGWNGLGTSSDVFTQSIVLWALAEVPTAEYRFIQEGVDTLIREMNQDGSWGNAPGEVGNVENTALSLLALVAAGENCFVPARLSRAALIELQNQLGVITNERNVLKQDFEKRVQDECGYVVRERDGLRKENKDLKGKVQTGEQELQKAREARENAELRLSVVERELGALRISSLESRDLLISSRTSDETAAPSEGYWRALAEFVSYVPALRIAAVLLPALASAGLIYYFWASPVSAMRVALQVLTGLVGLGLSVLVWLATDTDSTIIFDRPLRYDGLGYPYRGINSYRAGLEAFDLSDDSELTSLRRLYLSITEPLPPDTREELSYRLLTELAEMPPDIGRRYFEDLTYKLELPGSVRVQLTTWVRIALGLEPHKRRVLFDSLRRLSHGL